MLTVDACHTSWPVRALPLCWIYIYKGKYTNFTIKYACTMLIKSRPSNHCKYHNLFYKIFAFNLPLWSFFIISKIILLVTPSPLKPLLINVHEVVHWVELNSIGYDV